MRYRLRTLQRGFDNQHNGARSMMTKTRCTPEKLYWSPSQLVVIACLGTVLLAIPCAGRAADAPGTPGDASVWAPAAKDFLGTSASSTSRVYFTGAEGIVTEVFYPTLDRVQNVDLQFLVIDAARTWSAQDAEERKQAKHDVSLINNRHWPGRPLPPRTAANGESASEYSAIRAGMPHPAREIRDS